MRNHHVIAALIAACHLACVPTHAQPVPLSTAFTYQGELQEAGAAVNGVYDLRFQLFDAAAGSTPIGPTLCADNTTVINGRFTVQLDFGPAFSGAQAFLEVSVRPDTGTGCSDSAGLTTLAPRQPVSAAPNALFSLAAANAGTLNGQPSTFYRNAGNLTGTLPLSSLPASVARLDANQVFTGQVTLSNPANMLAGNGGGLTNLSGMNISPGTVGRSRFDSDVNDTLGIWSVAGPNRIMGWGRNDEGQVNIPPPPPGEYYTSIATGFGNNNAAALTSGGKLIAWGDNTLGQNDVPPLPPGQYFVLASTGAYHTVALTSAGELLAWGNNSFGQLDLPALPPGRAIQQISAGAYHSAVLLDDGEVICWGNDTVQQLQVPPPPPGEFYTAISAGISHTLALTNQGHAVAWGSNLYGERDLPQPPPGQIIVAIAAGGNHSLLLTSAGAVIGSGRAAQNQLNPPTLPPGQVFVGIGAGIYHSLGVTNAGAAYAWGSSVDGQCDVPAPPVGTTFRSVTGGGNHSLAIVGAPASSGVVAASAFAGDGKFLTNLSAANLTGTLAAASLTGVNGSGLTDVNASLLDGHPGSYFLDAANLTGTLPAAALAGVNGSGLTDVNASRLNGHPDSYFLDAANLTGVLPAAVLTGVNGSGLTSINAAMLNGQPASFYSNASNLTSGTLPAGRLSGVNGGGLTNVNAATLNGQASSFYTNAANLTGTLPSARLSGVDGAGLINVNAAALNGQPASFYTDAANLTGALADARLSSNVALRNASNAFGNFTNSFAGNVGIGQPSPSFPLHVVSSTNLISSFTSSATGGTWFNLVNTSTGGVFWKLISTGSGNGEGAGCLLIRNGASAGIAGGSVMSFQPNGFVGIGITDPGVNRLQVNGTFTATVKNFTIDHPQDPANKLLVHSTIESDEYLNIYSGVAVTDDQGFATITLPAWFESLNTSPRYQLTVTDEHAPDVHFARIASKVKDGRFVIKTVPGNLEVSWQVTAARNDAYARAHPLQVEQTKPARYKGKFLHPAEHGQPASLGVDSPTSDAAAAPSQP
ncbi:MAG: hypothetical protein JSR77_13450 [Planctomycetes bacterium]|nr:hypothetical protein [Planctomycetota bacterium]